MPADNANLLFWTICEWFPFCRLRLWNLLFQEILGKPDDVASNVLSWFYVDGQGEVVAALSVVTSQGKVTASSYLENVKDKRAASRRYRAAQRELSPVLGSPVQEVPGFLSAWFPEKLHFGLMIVEDEQPPAVVFF